MNPTGTGYLSEYPAGTADPGQPLVAFYAGANQGSGLTASSVGPTGQQTITNHSQGTVDVAVTVRGFFLAPIAPVGPTGVTVTVSGSSATVSWTPPAIDGGAPITGYTVTASPDNATVAVSGTTTQAAFNGLANAAADSFFVTASNAAGTSESAGWSPANVISGTVLSPAGQPVSGATVDIYTADVPGAVTAPGLPVPESTDWTSAAIGTATTDASGIWTYTVPPYSALPADAQAAADDNGGYLNMDASVIATATAADGTAYNVGADAFRSAFVGSSTQPSGPVAVDSPAGAIPSMTVTPDQADLSAEDTTAAEQSAPTNSLNPNLMDASGNFIGDQANANASAPTDAYGYQNIAGSVANDGYNPYIAADGTDLSQAPVSGTKPCPPPCDPTICGDVFRRVSHAWYKAYSYTTIGEYHIYWDGTGDFSYTQGATSEVGVDVSANAQFFKFDFYIKYHENQGSESGVSGVPAADARHVAISLKYYEVKARWAWVTPSGTVEKVCKTRWFIQEGGLYNPGNGWAYIRWDGKSILYQDGQNGFNKDPNSYRYMNKYGSYGFLCTDRGRGQTYGIAATIGGVGIQAETDHSSDTQQCDYWGGGKRTDPITHKKNSHWHYAWGSNEPAGNSPKIFYNW